jgi:hypothetical protein
MTRTFLVLLLVKLLVLGSLYCMFNRTTVDRRCPLYLHVSEGSSRTTVLQDAQASFAKRLTCLDGQFYLKIAKEGYSFHSSTDFAFFPLFPLLVTLLSAPFGDPVVCGIVINFVASLFGLLILSRVITIATGAHPLPTLLLLLAFPTAGFYNFFYTESLFLLLSSATLYLTLNHRFALAALLGFLCGLVRPQGVLLALPVLVEAWKHFRSRAAHEGNFRASLRLLSGIAPLAGMASYALYVGSHTGDLLSIFHVQSAWNRNVGPHALTQLLSEAGSWFRTDVLAAVFGVALLPVLFRRLPLSIAVFGLGMVIMPLATGNFLSFARFMATSSPHFMALCLILNRRPAFLIAGFAAMLSLQLFFNHTLMSWVFCA